MRLEAGTRKEVRAEPSGFLQQIPGYSRPWKTMPPLRQCALQRADELPYKLRSNIYPFPSSFSSPLPPLSGFGFWYQCLERIRKLPAGMLSWFSICLNLQFPNEIFEVFVACVLAVNTVGVFLVWSVSFWENVLSFFFSVIDSYQGLSDTYVCLGVLST